MDREELDELNIEILRLKCVSFMYKIEAFMLESQLMGNEEKAEIANAFRPELQEWMDICHRNPHLHIYRARLYDDYMSISTMSPSPKLGIEKFVTTVAPSTLEIDKTPITTTSRQIIYEKETTAIDSNSQKRKSVSVDILDDTAKRTKSVTEPAENHTLPLVDLPEIEDYNLVETSEIAETGEIAELAITPPAYQNQNMLQVDFRMVPHELAYLYKSVGLPAKPFSGIRIAGESALLDKMATQTLAYDKEDAFKSWINGEQTATPDLFTGSKYEEMQHSIELIATRMNIPNAKKTTAELFSGFERLSDNKFEPDVEYKLVGDEHISFSRFISSENEMPSTLDITSSIVQYFHVFGVEFAKIGVCEIFFHEGDSHCVRFEKGHLIFLKIEAKNLLYAGEGEFIERIEHPAILSLMESGLCINALGDYGRDVHHWTGRLCVLYIIGTKEKNIALNICKARGPLQKGNPVMLTCSTIGSYKGFFADKHCLCYYCKTFVNDKDSVHIHSHTKDCPHSHFIEHSYSGKFQSYGSNIELFSFLLMEYKEFFNVPDMCVYLSCIDEILSFFHSFFITHIYLGVSTLSGSFSRFSINKKDESPAADRIYLDSRNIFLLSRHPRDDQTVVEDIREFMRNYATAKIVAATAEPPTRD